MTTDPQLQLLFVLLSVSGLGFLMGWSLRSLTSRLQLNRERKRHLRAVEDLQRQMRIQSQKADTERASTRQDLAVLTQRAIRLQAEYDAMRQHAELQQRKIKRLQSDRRVQGDSSTSSTGRDDKSRDGARAGQALAPALGVPVLKRRSGEREATDSTAAVPAAAVSTAAVSTAADDVQARSAGENGDDTPTLAESELPALFDDVDDDGDGKR